MKMKTDLTKLKGNRNNPNSNEMNIEDHSVKRRGRMIPVKNYISVLESELDQIRESLYSNKKKTLMVCSDIVLCNNKIKETVKDLATEFMTKLHSFQNYLNKTQIEESGTTESLAADFRTLDQTYHHISVEMDLITRRLTKCEEDVGNYLSH